MEDHQSCLILQLQQEVQQLTEEMTRLHKQLKAKDNVIQAQRRELDTQQQVLHSTKEYLAQVEGELHAKEKIVKMQDLMIVKKGAELTEMKEHLEKLTEEQSELNRSFQTLQRETSKIKRRNDSLKHHLTSKEMEVQQLQHYGANMETKNGSHKSTTMVWKKQVDAPFSGKFGSAAVLGNLVCIRVAGSSDIHICNVTNMEWFQAPPCPLDACSLVAVKNTLTVAGGRIDGNVSNLLYSIHMKSFRAMKKQPWKEQFPPMLTKRMFAMSASSANVLAVVGGWNGRQPLHTVEVLRLDHDPMNWIKTSPLPSPIYSASASICQGNLFILGGFTQKGPTKTVICAPVFSLLDSKVDNPWHRVTALPMFRSTCTTFKDRLLSFGGENEEDTGFVFEYNGIEDEWHMVSQMPTPSCQSCVAVLTERKEIIVVGGHSATFGRTCTVQTASIEL